MTGQLFLGIDAGGTHCRARLVDGEGNVLGSGRSGPANLTLGVAHAHRSIVAAGQQAFAAAKLGRAALRRTTSGLVEAVREILTDPATPVLVVVDQFEELFRYQPDETDEDLPLFPTRRRLSPTCCSKRHGQPRRTSMC